MDGFYLNSYNEKLTLIKFRNTAFMNYTSATVAYWLNNFYIPAIKLCSTDNTNTSIAFSLLSLTTSTKKFSILLMEGSFI